MKKPRFVDTDDGESLIPAVGKADHRLLAVWAADCAGRVLPLFESELPGDTRPRDAIRAARKWARDGIFRMAEVRRVSLNAHAAARLAQEDSGARFAARSAGHAIATAHVPTHSLAAAWYAAKAVWARDPENGQKNVVRERRWQYRRLVKLAAAPLESGSRTPD